MAAGCCHGGRSTAAAASWLDLFCKALGVCGVACLVLCDEGAPLASRLGLVGDIVDVWVQHCSAESCQGMRRRCWSGMWAANDSTGNSSAHVKDL